MRRSITQHSLSVRLKKLALPVAVVAITVGATSAFASLTLTNIYTAPSWSPTDTGNEGRCISPDGKYVGGILSPSNLGFLYDVVNDVVRQPNGGGAVPQAQGVTGMAYRTSGANTELILDGMSSGYQANWMTTDGGLTWGGKRRNTSYTQASVLPAANSLGAATGSDVFTKQSGTPPRLRFTSTRGLALGFRHLPFPARGSLALTPLP